MKHGILWHCHNSYFWSLFVCASSFFLLFWVTVQHLLWSTCLQNRCGSFPLALSAFICCVQPSQTAWAPPFLYQCETEPFQSLHHSYVRSSLLLVKHHWRQDREQRKYSCFPLQHHRGHFHAPFCFYNFLRTAAAMQILVCCHF